MSNPFDQFDEPAKPAANPFDQFDPPAQPVSEKIADAGKLAVRGATSEGFYFGMEGLARMADNINRDADTDRAKGPEYTGLARSLGELERAEYLGKNTDRQRQIAQIRGRMDELSAAAAPKIEELKNRKPDDTLLGWYAGAVRDTREKIKHGLPVAPESERALWGQIAQGVGQAVGTLPTYAIPGLGPSATVGQLYQQGYEDAKESGADESMAHDAGVKNVPAAALEYLSDKLIIGKVLKPLKGKLTVRELLKGLAISAASEGGTEGVQQGWQNYVASSLSGYDPDRPLDDGVINAAVVGAAVGGIAGGGGPLVGEGVRRIEERGMDTGRNKPERPADLKAQQQQLVAGDRVAQMFPLGTEELPLPAGMARVETPRGVFHFDPKNMTADEILSASKKGKENTILGLGPFDKAEVMKRAAKGEPVAVVTERGPNGEELRGALATPSTEADTTAALEAGKSAGSTVQVEPLKETLERRDVADEIEKSLPDGESKDYLRGRTKEDLKRQAEVDTDLPALWKNTVDAVLKVGVGPKEFSALDRMLELLNDKQGRKEAGLRAKVTADRITAMLGNTVLDGALRGSDFARLVTALAKSPANIDALRAEFKAASEGAAAESAPAPGPAPGVETSEPKPAPAVVPQRQRGELPRMGDEVDRLVRRMKLREQIAAEAATATTQAAEIAKKKAAAEKALADAAAKRKAEGERLAVIDRTGRDPESGLIADLRKVPSQELENFDWDKDRYMHEGDEVKPEDIEAVLGQRYADEERAAAGENAAGYTLQGLLKGKPDELRAAGLSGALRLMSPKEARDRGTLGGEHASLRERTGGFAYFSRDGLVEDGLQEKLAELGFDVPDVAAAYELVERAMNGEEITPQERSRDQVQFVRRQVPAIERPPTFARRSHKRAQQIEALATKWWQSLDKIAPGLSKEAELRLTSADDFVEQGLARRDELTGEEEAARVRDIAAKKEIFYLFQQALRKNTADVTRLNLQHEMGHAFWDTLDRVTQRQLQELFAREVETKTGPLFDADGNLRDNVALGATEDIQEWFAERLAHANDRWAQRRVETAARSDTIMAAVAAQFRRLLVAMRELIEKHMKVAGYDDGLLADFRKFLDQGTRWAGEPAVAPERAAAPAFARRAKTDAEFETALNTFEKLDRERQRQLEKTGKTDRALLEQLSEARMVLENSWPGWREDLKERQAETDANETRPPEPEAGVSADDDVREIDPQATAWKRSRFEASSFRPPGSLTGWISGIGNLFKNFRSAIPELPAGAAGREFMRFKQGYRMLKAATEAVRHDAEERIAHVLEPITKLGREGIAPDEYRRLVNVQAAIKSLNEDGKPAPEKLHHELAALEEKLDKLPYHLFRKTVLYRDLWFRTKIMNASGEPITLPQNLTRDEVEEALRDLHAKIAASPDRAAIEESLKRHYALVKTTRDDLLARGYIIPEELRNPLYFPHLVLEKFSGRLQSVKLDTAEDFRSYLQQLTGSAKDIETDYLTAMYYHMGQVMAHNARQDIVADYWQPYDIKEDLEREAKALNAERAEKGLGPLHWRQLVGKDHVVYTVDDRIPLRPEYIINRQVLADRLGVELGEGDLQAQLRELGLNVTLTAADFQAAMAAGEKQLWVLPRPVAAALDGILERETQSRSLLSRVLSAPQSLWKRWILYAPQNVVRYTYGNLVADLEKLFSADPAVFGKLLPAYREVREFMEGGQPSEDLKEAFRRGVIQSVTAAEVNDLPTAKRFEVFLTSPAKLLNNIGRGVQWGRTVNELREAAFRYAKFKADLERMRNGERPVYAGAYHRDVEAITDTKPADAIFAKAAEIARKTFVDYGDISVSGDGLRRYFLPFYSWMEGNFKYHANLFRNLGDMSVGAGMSQLSRGGLVAASKVVLPRSVAGVLLRLALPYVAVSIWNNSGDREELEKTLSAEDRRRFHIILGKDAQGRTLVTYAPTALSDVAGWFGGMDMARLAGEYWRGSITLPQAVHEWFSNTPTDVLNKAVQGISPQLKAVYIAASRRNPFPDVFDQRSISDHDLSWAILGSMTDAATTEGLRNIIDKDYYSPRSGGDWMQQIILQVRRRDPEQWGYYATMDRVDAWQKAHGGTVDFGTNNKADAALLSSFRRAIRAADVPAAIGYYHRLIEAGYTSERFAASVRAADPLQTLKKEHRQEFFDSLTPAEQQDVRNGYRYAQRMEAFKRHERQLFPSQRASAGYRERFAAAPRDDVFSGIMLDASGRSDEDEDQRADKMLKQSLRK